MEIRPKKLRILEAAFEVFSEKGFHGSKVEEIAEKAGVGKGTIYEYFKNKVHLFQEMYKWHVESFFNDLGKDVDNQETSREKIYMLLKNNIMLTKNFKNLAGKLLNESGAHVDFSPEFKKTMLDLYKQKINRVEEVLLQGIEKGEIKQLDSELAAIYIFSVLAGISHSLVLSTKDYETDEVVEKVLDFILNGIKKN